MSTGNCCDSSLNLKSITQSFSLMTKRSPHYGGKCHTRLRCPPSQWYPCASLQTHPCGCCCCCCCGCWVCCVCGWEVEDNVQCCFLLFWFSLAPISSFTISPPLPLRLSSGSLRPHRRREPVRLPFCLLASFVDGLAPSVEVHTDPPSVPPPRHVSVRHQETEITTISKMVSNTMSSNLFVMVRFATAKLKMKMLLAGFPWLLFLRIADLVVDAVDVLDVSVSEIAACPPSEHLAFSGITKTLGIIVSSLIFLLHKVFLSFLNLRMNFCHSFCTNLPKLRRC